MLNGFDQGRHTLIHSTLHFFVIGSHVIIGGGLHKFLSKSMREAELAILETVHPISLAALLSTKSPDSLNSNGQLRS